MTGLVTVGFRCLCDLFFRDGSAIENKTFEDAFGDINSDKETPKRKFEYPPNVEDFNNPQFQSWKSKREEKLKDKSKNIREFPAILRDENGEEEVTVYTRGDSVALRMGEFWEWTGDDFATLQWGFQQRLLNMEQKFFKATTPEEYLTEFSLTFEMPINLIDLRNKDPKGSATTSVPLRVEVEVEHGVEMPQRFRLSLPFEGKRYQSNVNPSTNQCLKDIMGILPSHLMLKSCWSCAYANYSPLGFSHIGGLGCFKGDESMKNSRSSKDIFSKWTKRVDDVQEQHVCEGWTPRESTHKMPKLDDFRKRKWNYEFE